MYHFLCLPRFKPDIVSFTCDNHIYHTTIILPIYAYLSIISDINITSRHLLHSDSIHTAWVPAQLCKLQKECTRLAAASDKVYQLLAQGRWFSLGTPASSTTKTGRHDIAESGVKHQKSINQSTHSIQLQEADNRIHNTSQWSSTANK